MDRTQDTAPRLTPTTRHHRCDFAFLELLEEDFGIGQPALRSALMGTPPEPKRAAIAICAWAVAVASEDPDRALLSWARKNGRGSFGL